MGVTKTVRQSGNGVDKPKEGDEIALEYTGHLYDSTKEDSKGSVFDTSEGRGEFRTRIGSRLVIKGWDVGILDTDGGMTLGEQATFVITSDHAYGANGYPGLIPPNSDLVFDIELKEINGKRMFT